MVSNTIENKSSILGWCKLSFKIKQKLARKDKIESNAEITEKNLDRGPAVKKLEVNRNPP